MSTVKQVFSEKSNVFLVCLIAFIVGIFAGNFFIWDGFYLLCLLLSLALALFFLWHNRQARVIVLLSLFLVLGLWRIQVSAPSCHDRPELLCHYNGQEVKFIATIIDDKVSIGKQTLQLASSRVIFDSKAYAAKGKALISQPLYPQYSYGDMVMVSCPLGMPKPSEDFDYGKYLQSKGIESFCPYGDVRKISEGGGNPVKAAILGLRSAMSEALKSSVSEPESSILRAMILNETGDIPVEINERFSNLGLTHIIAISGSHITIIVTLIMYLAIALGLSRPRAFWAAAVGIAVYVAMVGSPASAVRAAVMGILVIYAQKSGRGTSAGRLIVLAAAVMLAANPMLLVYDAGFQLSFMAVLGLVYFSPLLEKLLARIPETFQLREMLSATLSAQAMTLPLIVYQFGRFAPVSILANILILPVIPFLTVFALVNALVGAIIPPLGMLMGWVSWLFTWYWLWISQLMQKVNYLPLAAEIGWPVLVVSYVAICLLIFKFRRFKVVD